MRSGVLSSAGLRRRLERLYQELSDLEIIHYDDPISGSKHESLRARSSSRTSWNQSLHRISSARETRMFWMQTIQAMLLA